MKFRVYFDGEVTLPVVDIWPDGDGPDEPTPEDVKKVMEKCGGKGFVLNDWNLLSELRAMVGPDGPGRPIEVW